MGTPFIGEIRMFGGNFAPASMVSSLTQSLQTSVATAAN